MSRNMKFMHFTKINENVMFCFETLLQINSGEVLRKVVPKRLKMPLRNKHSAMVRFYDFLSRTCIGDNGLRSLLEASCQSPVSGLNPAYV